MTKLLVLPLFSIMTELVTGQGRLPDCLIFGQYVSYPHLDYVKGVATPMLCMNHCRGNTDCYYFKYNEKRQECQLQKRDGPVRRKVKQKGFVSGAIANCGGRPPNPVILGDPKPNTKKNYPRCFEVNVTYSYGSTVLRSMDHVSSPSECLYECRGAALCHYFVLDLDKANCKLVPRYDARNRNTKSIVMGSVANCGGRLPNSAILTYPSFSSAPCENGGFSGLAGLSPGPDYKHFLGFGDNPRYYRELMQQISKASLEEQDQREYIG